MDDQELRKLAIDIYEGRVFGSWSVNDPSLIGSIFMPIGLGAELPEDIGHVYEYMSEAGERSINGYPMFFSCRILTQSQCEALLPMMDELKEHRESFLNCCQVDN